MITLPQVTLLGIDCIEVERLARALTISEQAITFGAVKLLTSLPSTDSRVITISPISSVDSYSHFCLTKLSQHVETSHVLVVQHDGFVLNPSAWQDSWLEYDYTGAPIEIGDWTVERHGVPTSEIGLLVVGNGGFSLRSKKLLETVAALIASGEIVLGDPEDWLMCYTYRSLLESHGIRFAPPEVAAAFSFEGRSRDYYQYRDSFGFHSLQWTDISLWLEANPEYKPYYPQEVNESTFL